MTEEQIKLVAEESDLKQETAKILCVDDEEFNLEILEKQLTKEGYKAICASSGEEAWKILQQSLGEIDIVLLDRMMPGMDGLEVLRKMKQDPQLQDIPVIMQTAAVTAEEAVEGIEAGAYYYVTKPYAAKMLISIVHAAQRDSKYYRTMKHEVDKRHEIFPLLQNGEIELKTLKEVRAVARFLANYSAEPSRVIMGLTALLTNAVEHGNLGVGFDKKQELLVSGQWENEVQQRLGLPENENKIVKVHFAKDKNSVKITIKDAGEGFDWKPFMDFDPARMTEPNGRGIAMANIMSPGCIEYLGKGNEVVYSITH